MSAIIPNDFTPATTSGKTKSEMFLACSIAKDRGVYLIRRQTRTAFLITGALLSGLAWQAGGSQKKFFCLQRAGALFSVRLSTFYGRSAVAVLLPSKMRFKTADGQQFTLNIGRQIMFRFV